MTIPSIQTAFSAGEVGPSLYGHIDLAKFSVGLSTERNCFVNYRGGAYSRAGTSLCLQSKQVVGTGAPRIFTYQFNQSQGYCVEIGDHYMRFFSMGAPVVEGPVAITNVTNANPAALFYGSSFLQPGDWIFVSGVMGMTPVNGNTYIVIGVTVDQVALGNLDGSALNSLPFPAYISGGQFQRVFTLPTPWAIADVGMLKLGPSQQSADVMTITHPSYPPYDLARISGTDWTLTQTSFGADISAPATVSVVATVQPNPGTSPPTLPAAYAYVVTAINAATGEESVASQVANVTNSVDIAATAGSHVVTWSAVAGALTYNIYVAPTSYNTDPTNPNVALPVPGGAIFSYIGTSYGTQFVNSNIVPDFTTVPPIHNNPFAAGAVVEIVIDSPGAGYTEAVATVSSVTGTGAVVIMVTQSNGAVTAGLIEDGGENYRTGDTITIVDGGGTGAGALAHIVVGPLTGVYPSVAAYFQQRRVYANSNNNPDTYWMSKPGLFTNFDTAIPVTDTDSITGSPWALQVDGIQFLEPMPGGLVVFAGSQVWQLGGSGSSAQFPQPITPASQQATAQAFSGTHFHIGPIRINSEILYVQSKGSIVRELVYNIWFTRYDSIDLTILSGQLFTGYSLTYWCYCEEPYKIVWATRNDGAMLSLTYVKEQQVQGWARHDTFGSWICCTAVTEVPPETALSGPIVSPPGVDALYLVAFRPANELGSGGAYFIERMDNRIWQDVENVWAVDCAISLPQPTPNADIAANGVGMGETVTFVTDAAAFDSTLVFPVIRMNGGIAVVTVYVSPTEVQGVWYLPPSLQLTDGTQPAGVVAIAGSWSITQPVESVGGLQHLIGLTVTGLADGVPIPPTVVAADGTIPLPFFASAIVVGLGFTAQAQTLYLNTQEPVTIQGRRKDILNVVVRTDASLGLQIGTNQPDGAAQSPPTLAPPWSGMVNVDNLGGTYFGPGGETVTELYTGDTYVNALPNWTRPGQIAVQQLLPLPMNITALVPGSLEGDTPEGMAQQSQGGGGQQRPGQMPPPANRSGARPWMGAR